MPNENPESHSILNPKRIILKIPGGPPARLRPTASDEIYREIIGPNDFMLSLANSADVLFSEYPNEGLSKSAANVRILIDRMQSAFPAAELVVVGESLGGVIATEAVQGSHGNHISLIMINPMMETPVNQLALGKALGRIDMNFDMKVNTTTISSDGKREWRKVNSGQLLLNFFPKSDFDLDLYDRLNSEEFKSENFHSISILYGEKDELSSTFSRNRLKSIPFVRMYGIPNLHHRMDPANIPVVAEALVRVTGR